MIHVFALKTILSFARLKFQKFLWCSRVSIKIFFNLLWLEHFRWFISFNGYWFNLFYMAIKPFKYPTTFKYLSDGKWLMTGNRVILYFMYREKYVTYPGKSRTLSDAISRILKELKTIKTSMNTYDILWNDINKNSAVKWGRPFFLLPLKRWKDRSN